MPALSLIIEASATVLAISIGIAFIVGVVFGFLLRPGRNHRIADSPRASPSRRTDRPSRSTTRAPQRDDIDLLRYMPRGRGRQ